MNRQIYSAFVAELGAIMKMAADGREPQPWTAEEEAADRAMWAKKKPPGPLKIGLQGAAGVGLGTLAGGLAGKGIEYAAGRSGFSLPPHLARIGAIAGAGAGLAHQLWKAKEQEGLRRDAEYSEQTAQKFPRE